MNRKLINALITTLVVISMLLGGKTSTPVKALPLNPTDETKVPHYFGPYPNWANSPFTLPDVSVEIIGDGAGATAAATVGANGAVTDITITDPGSGYTSANVVITGGGTNATADAFVSSTGAVTGISLDTTGSGYTTPVVSIEGGGSMAVPAAVTALGPIVFDVTRGSATGGTFALNAGGTLTAPIAWDATALDVENALAAAGFTAIVTGDGSALTPWLITFAVSPGTLLIDAAGLTQGVSDAALTQTVSTYYSLHVGSATGGTFSLTVDGTTTAPIAYNALSTDIAAALPAGTTVTGSGTAVDPWIITFVVAPASFTFDGAGLTQGVADAALTQTLPTDYSLQVGSATGGTFLLTVDGLTTLPLAFNALPADIELALLAVGATATVTGTGTALDPWAIIFAVAPLSFTFDGAGLTQGVADAALTQVDTTNTSLHVGSATGGTFLLTVDASTTPPLAYNALTTEIEAALLAAGAPATVTGSGTVLDPWVITFAVSPASFTFDGAGLTQGVSDTIVNAYVTEFSVTAGSANGGTFTLSIDGFTTAPIAWNASAADVEFAINAGVTASVAGSGPWTVSFATAPTSFTIDGTGLISSPANGATATAYGGVDVVTLIDPGIGYSFPTVDFDMPDSPDGVQASGHVVCLEVDCIPVDPNTTVTIIDVVVDDPGSGYSVAPNVVIRDGTIFDPVPSGGTGATATATLALQNITVNTYGTGYTTAPAVTITDATGTGVNATATASIDTGAVTAIVITNPGADYITQGGIKKFQDGLPQLCIPAAGQTFANCTDNNLGQHIPVGVPDTTTFSVANGFTAESDYYVIAVVQHRERMSSSLPAGGTLLREYVQLETPANASFSKHVPLTNDLLDGSSVPALLPDGTQAYAVDDPHFLGPVIVATKDKAVRIVFYNLLPEGVNGDLFLPVDSSMMGSGMGPMDMMMPPMNDSSVMDEVRNPACTEYPGSMDCFLQSRATLHLHGGITPWISDGTPHQWITPANSMTPWPQGVAVSEVPDMVVPGVPDCSGENDGCMTFYYTNQQSARMLFYHDHSWGITRLNVYAGEAAGYLITDATEQALISSGTIPGMADTIPLIIQDRTFVPDVDQLAAQDPTWNSAQWGTYGSLWYHHVYMPAQNPGDPGGMSSYGRWMYGPWFWPPATPPYGPIPNPYFNMDPEGLDGIRGTADDFQTPLAVPCSIDVPSTWQYDTDPFCEPELIPGTPNVSVGMEQFNDTPLVNGTAYPYVNIDPKTYRMRILNAANDRFWNLQWYVADPSTGTLSEVALNEAEVAAAQLDPVQFPTPDTSSDGGTDPSYSLPGPDWIQIGSEGGFLPAPIVIDGQQVTTWINDPTRFDVGNVDQHSLALAPAERADVIVDFSQFAGQTLILYNDAPAAYPARVPSYDYYTGYPDQSPNGPSIILPGYGPNTRTIMQVRVSSNPPAPAFNLPKLQSAFRHKANGSGVFESGQNPIIVGQAAYNSAYGTSFAASGYCSSPSATNKCDGFVRINQQGGDMFTFDTLRGSKTIPWTKMAIRLEPKAIHDEMNAVAFDEFGRMTANLGVETVPATPANQNVTLYPYVNPSTEIIDSTNLPRADVKVQPIASGADGTQLWKITHNGVDTHPIHFHLYDVQVLNRVTWDNIIIPPEPNELGWKDTVRISPLQDTIVALRAIIPVLPFEIPNSIRMLNPMMPAGDTSMFNNTDIQGNPTAPIVNQLVNFGWEYVYHCHILSHEEMDMMRPVILAVPPIAPTGLAWSVSGSGGNTVLTLTWNDNSINETAFTIQNRTGAGAWTDVGTVVSPLDQPNTHGIRTFDDTNFRLDKNVYQYRVVAKNTVGYGAEFPSTTVQSLSGVVTIMMAPSNLRATLQNGPQVRLTFTDNANNETGFSVERAENGGGYVQIAVLPVNNGPTASYVDVNVAPGVSYTYRVAALSALGASAYSNTASVTLPTLPAAPGNLTAVNGPDGPGNTRSVILTWADLSDNETSFTIQRATNPTFTGPSLVNVTAAANATTITQTGLARGTMYYYRIRANNGVVFSLWVDATPFPILTLP